MSQDCQNRDITTFSDGHASSPSDFYQPSKSSVIDWAGKVVLFLSLPVALMLVVTSCTSSHPMVSHFPVTAEETALLESFQEAYQLAPGQNVRLIQQPSQDIRLLFFRRLDRAFRDNTRAPHMMILTDDGKRLRFREGFAEATAVDYMVSQLIDISPNRVQGDPELAKSQFTADLVVRKGVRKEVLLRELEEVLQNDLKLLVRLDWKKENSEVIIEHI